jgi:hypothetical protein
MIVVPTQGSSAVNAALLRAAVVLANDMFAAGKVMATIVEGANAVNVNVNELRLIIMPRRLPVQQISAC